MKDSIDAQIGKTLRDAKTRLELDTTHNTVVTNVLSLEAARREEILRLTRDVALSEPPSTPTELWHAIRLLFGYRVPLTSTHPDFHAPFEWFSNVFFNQTEDSVALASRGGGKTIQASMLMSMLSMWRPAYDAVHAGGTQVQAQVASAYLSTFYNMPWLKGEFESRPAKFSANWKNQSSWRIVTGSMKGVCLSGNTSIQTDQGVLPIEDIVRRKLQVNVLSYNFETQSQEFKPVVGWHDNGKETEFVRVTLAYASRAVWPAMTQNHEVYLLNGTKVQANSLRSGDRVAVEGYVPSEEQRQIVLGGLLGDSSIGKCGRLSFVHGLSQKDYLEWKVDALRDYGVEVSPMVGGFGTECIKARFQASPWFKELRDVWYPDGVKQISLQLLDDLGHCGLAVWLMDDGCYAQKHWTIYTNGFNTDSIQAIKEWFNSKGLCPKVDTVDGTQQIRFGVQDSQVINDWVNDYLLTDSGTKVWRYRYIKVGQTGIVGVPVKHVRPVTLHKSTKKYDITVEDNHNFFLSSGMLVSNSGQHPNILTLDEIEFWEIEALTQTFENPIPKNGYKRIWTAFSTRQRSYGAMNWLVDEAPKRGFRFYQWSVFEVMEPCVTCEATDKEPYGDDAARTCVCPLWDACRGERAKKSTGWLPLAEARKKCIRLGGPQGREWQTQGLCNRPSSHGLVLHNFEHAYKPEGNYTKWTYVADLPWYAVHDPSEGKKSVIYFLQRYNGMTFCFDELVDALCPDVTKAKQDFFDHCQRMGYPDPAVIVVDPHRTDAVATWKVGSKSGVGIMHKYFADVPDTTELTGVTQFLNKTLELLRQSICDGGGNRRLFINPDYCPHAIRATKEYHYPTDPVTNEIISDNPDKAYSDEIDPFRYWEMYVLTKLNRSGGRVLVM